MIITPRIFYNLKFNLKNYRSMISESELNKRYKKIKIKYEESNESNKITSNDNELSLCLNKKLNLIKNYESSISSIENFPINFHSTWDKIQKMRESKDAVVDSMGVEFTADKNADKPTVKFQTLISLLLSSQTKDPITFATMQKLILHGLTIDNIIQTKEDDLKEIIYGVSFHNNKTKYIKKLAEVLKETYNYNPPESLNEVMKLPGIGPKMAFLYLQCCCDKIEGIAVDTHVHRICNRLKWTKTKTPENTRKSLETWLPKNLWSDINLLLVGFGQTICSAAAPKCHLCSLNEECEFGIDRLKKIGEKKSKSQISKSLKRNGSIETRINTKKTKKK